MHKLEITGATPEDLFMNAVRMLSVLLKGGATTMPVDPAETASSAAETSSPPPSRDVADADGAGQVSEQEVIPPAAKKRGRPTKADAAKSETTKLDDDISDVGAGKTIEHDPNEAAEGKKPLTLDGDIRPRLRAIQKAHSERGHNMEACVAYLLKLYGPFGIQKADQLKPESFAEFMEASEAYLKGEA